MLYVFFAGNKNNILAKEISLSFTVFIARTVETKTPHESRIWSYVYSHLLFLRTLNLDRRKLFLTTLTRLWFFFSLRSTARYINKSVSNALSFFFPDKRKGNLIQSINLVCFRQMLFFLTDFVFNPVFQ